MFCFEVWSKNLSFDILKKWLSNYNFNNQSKTLGLVLAGNIPLVGLHDIICGLLCNYKLEIKLSSEDSHLIVFCLNYLSANNKLIKNNHEIKTLKLIKKLREKENMSYSKISNYLNDRNIKSKNKCDWYSSSVRSVYNNGVIEKYL